MQNSEDETKLRELLAQISGTVAPVAAHAVGAPLDRIGAQMDYSTKMVTEALRVTREEFVPAIDRLVEASNENTRTIADLTKSYIRLTAVIAFATVLTVVVSLIGIFLK